VIAVGEMRDRSTAEVVFQASLTGHLVLSTFHAGSGLRCDRPALRMGIEPYLLRSGVLAIVCQRLVAQAVQMRRASATIPKPRLGLPGQANARAGRLRAVRGTGYLGRTVLASCSCPRRVRSAARFSRAMTSHSSNHSPSRGA